MLAAMLARQAAAAVGVRTCLPWETAATLPSARRRKVLWRPRGEERGGGISWRPPAYSLFDLLCASVSDFSAPVSINTSHATFALNKVQMLLIDVRYTVKW